MACLLKKCRQGPNTRAQRLRSGGNGVGQPDAHNGQVKRRLAPMEARVGLCGDIVSTIFVAEQEAIVPVLEQHLPHLRSRFIEQGLDVAHLACHQGESDLPTPSTGRGGLVDEKA